MPLARTSSSPAAGTSIGGRGSRIDAPESKFLGSAIELPSSDDARRRSRSEYRRSGLEVLRSEIELPRAYGWVPSGIHDSGAGDLSLRGGDASRRIGGPIVSEQGTVSVLMGTHLAEEGTHRQGAGDRSLRAGDRSAPTSMLDPERRRFNRHAAAGVQSEHEREGEGPGLAPGAPSGASVRHERDVAGGRSVRGHRHRPDCGLVVGVGDPKLVGSGRNVLEVEAAA